MAVCQGHDFGKSVKMYSLYHKDEEGSLYKLTTVPSDGIGKNIMVGDKGEKSERNATDVWVYLL